MGAREMFTKKRNFRVILATEYNIITIFILINVFHTHLDPSFPRNPPSV